MKKIVFSLLIGGFVLASLAPTFYELSRMGDLKQERQFELVHNFPTDYNFYLSRIRQGLEGRLTVVEKYTSEPHAGSLLHEFYLLIGWVGRLIRMPWRPGDIYHVARVVLGISLLGLIAEFCRRAFQDDHNEIDRGVGAYRGSPFDSPRQGPTSSSPSSPGAKAVTGLEKARRAAPVSLFTFHTSTALSAGLSLIAFLLAVTASSWPKLVAVVNNQVVPATLENIANWRFGGYMSWWSVMDSLQRITFIPHLLAGQLLMTFLISSLTELKVLRSGKNILFLGVLAFLLGMVFPPGLVFVYGVMGVYLILQMLVGTWDGNDARIGHVRRLTKTLDVTGLVTGGRFTSTLRVWGSAYVAIILLSSAVLLYLFLMATFYPWKRLAEFDVLHPLPFDYLEYFKAVGPIGVIGVIGGIWALWKKEVRMYPAVAWVVAWLVFLGVFRFIPQQSPLRFSEMIPQVPLGVLAAYLFSYLSSRAEVGISWFSRRQGPDRMSVHRKNSAKAVTGLETKHLPTRLYRVILVLAPISLIFLGLAQMYSSWLWQKDFIDHKIRATLPLVPTGSYVMYPLKDFISAMGYLWDATKGEGVILSETTAGNYIPVYAGNTVYVGHDNTVFAEVKKELVKRFFAGKMDFEEARWFLLNNRIKAVFFGPQEREDGGVTDLRQVYPFLEEVYKNGYVTVYKVQ